MAALLTHNLTNKLSSIGASTDQLSIRNGPRAVRSYLRRHSLVIFITRKMSTLTTLNFARLLAGVNYEQGC